MPLKVKKKYIYESLNIYIKTSRRMNATLLRFDVIPDSFGFGMAKKRIGSENVLHKIIQLEFSLLAKPG